MHSRNIETPQVKKFEKTQKQLNEFKEDLNKYRNEKTEIILKRR
jgi:uncharacterized membrane-anchored protein YhcB (DUF1043 family)